MGFRSLKRLNEVLHHHGIYDFAEHITEPRPCWHENPVLTLARDLQQMSLSDHITENGYVVRKTWNKHTGNRYAIYDSGGRFVKAYRNVVEASKRVYGEL